MAKKTSSKKRVHKSKGESRSARKVVRRQTSKKKGAAKSAATRSTAQVARAIADLNWSHDTLAKLIKDWPGDRWTFQNAHTDGHALWILGHFAGTYAWCIHLITGEPFTSEVPAHFNTLFGYGSRPTNDPAAYPPASEVHAVYSRAWSLLIDTLSKLTDADLEKPCAGDAHGMANNVHDVVRLICWHEGWHQGQLSSLRKALGLPGIM